MRLILEIVLNTDIAYDITAYDITAYDITAYDITAYDITAYDITAYDITAYDITAYDIYDHVSLKDNASIAKHSNSYYSGSIARLIVVILPDILSKIYSMQSCV